MNTIVDTANMKKGTTVNVDNRKSILSPLVATSAIVMAGMIGMKAMDNPKIINGVGEIAKRVSECTKK